MLRHINLQFKTLAIKDRHTKCTRCNNVGCSWLTDKYGSLGHWFRMVQIIKSNFKNYFKRSYLKITALDYSKIDGIEMEINTSDAPDFCDSFITSATYKGRDMTDKELDRLNDDSDFVYECIQERLY